MVANLTGDEDSNPARRTNFMCGHLACTVQQRAWVVKPSQQLGWLLYLLHQCTQVPRIKGI